jgi:hypothetical protein
VSEALNKMCRRLASVMLLIAGLLLCNMSYADEICLKKPGFPGDDFTASVRYDLLTGKRVKFNILVEGANAPFDAQLEIFYGVPNNFLWSYERLYEGRYELSSRIAMDVVDDQIEGEVYLTEEFSNFALHLSLHPAGSDRVQFCQEDFQILVPKGSLDLKVKRGVVGQFEHLGKESNK